MTIHVFANIVTAYGTAANNRGENQGNATTLQKLMWKGRPHTTVSAEAIRFALRRRLEAAEPGSCNRTYNEETRQNDWRDEKFEGWSGKGKRAYADDDLLGFMKADAAKEEGGKGSTSARRAVLELTRAISLSPWAGDVMFNAASPGATPSAAKKGANPVPYAVEVHSTRYQYGLALTPSYLKTPRLAKSAIQSLCELGEVAGNHARFLYDFSPESVIFRITEDPAPRLLYCFEERDGTVSFPSLLARVRAGDIRPSELIVGGAIVGTFGEKEKADLSGAQLENGVMKACSLTLERLEQ